MQGKLPPVQVKEPNGNLNMVTCRLSSCNPECTKYTCRKRVWQCIEKEIDVVFFLCVVGGVSC